MVSHSIAASMYCTKSHPFVPRPPSPLRGSMKLGWAFRTLGSARCPHGQLRYIQGYSPPAFQAEAIPSRIIARNVCRLFGSSFRWFELRSSSSSTSPEGAESIRHRKRALRRFRADFAHCVVDCRIGGVGRDAVFAPEPIHALEDSFQEVPCASFLRGAGSRPGCATISKSTSSASSERPTSDSTARRCSADKSARLEIVLVTMQTLYRIPMIESPRRKPIED